MMSEIINMLSSDEEESIPEKSSDSLSSDDEEWTPAKKRRMATNDGINSFKEKVQKILETLCDAAPGEFVATGKLNAPLITIAIKNTESILHFPLYENEAGKIIELFEQSPYGKGQDTVVDTAVRNSWELNSDGFEIQNPAWNHFVNEEVVAKIKKEMFIEFSFTPALYKLLLYKSGSFFKAHRDSEKADGMFATLVIQLPSLYQGGQLVVRHDNKTVTSDFSSTESSNTFGTFFTAFYCDCEHEVLKVSEGYRVCLVYNLISHKSEIPTAPRRHALELELVKLIENWEHRGKLVYALKHKYSEKSLSFDNLKTTDRAIANFLVYIAKSNDLSVHLGILNKEYSGQDADDDGGSDADFDSDDEDYCGEKSYSLSKLISIDGENISNTSLSVNFDKEVIPDDCFENINPYRKITQPTGNEGTDVTRFYRSAAIVFFPKKNILEVLKKGAASVKDLDKLFLKEIEENRGKVNDPNVTTKLTSWANHIISSDDNKSIEIIKAIVEMKDIQLIQLLFSRGVHLNEISMPLMVDVCETYGWKTFAKQIPQMFEKLTKEVGIELLLRICTADMDQVKKAVVHSVMEVILKKTVNPLTSSSRFYYACPKTEDNMERRLEEQEFLLLVCRLAERVDFKMLNYATSKAIVLFVPVLLRLVPNESKTLTSFWKDIAMHFVQKMEMEASKPVLITNWRRSERSDCSCKDCIPLNAFLASDQETIRFTMGKVRRFHLHQIMNCMQDISHKTDRLHLNGVLVIRKTSKSGADEAEKRVFSTDNLTKLQLILPN